MENTRIITKKCTERKAYKYESIRDRRCRTAGT
jgi:hypothetical protein